MVSPILPIAMRLSAEPGQRTHGEFVLQGSMPTGTIVATLRGDPALFRLREIVATDQIFEDLTAEEIAQLPPSMRDNPPQGVRFEEFSRAGDGQPLRLKPGVDVRGLIECFAPTGAPMTHRATLTIEGLAGVIEMPITFVTAGVRIEFPQHPVVVRQGQSVTTQLRIALPGAPATDLTVEISHGFAEIAQTPVHVPEGVAATIPVTISTSPSTPLGPLTAAVTVRGHSQNFDFIPVQLQVLPPVRPPQVDKPAMIARIHETYLQLGGHTGNLGFPTSEVTFSGNTATRRYRGGEVRARAEFDEERQIGVVTQALVTQGVRITFVGFRCVRLSNELSASDEPYFIVSVMNGDDQTRVEKFGPFENVKAGTEIGIGATLLSGRPLNPTTILAVAYENDEGDPDETAKKLREKAAEVVQQAQSLIAASASGAADGPGIGTAAAASTAAGLISGPIGALLAGAIVSLFGLGDDYVGQDVAMLFQNPDSVGNRKAIGKFRDNDFNVRIAIDGHDEGSYELFFFFMATNEESHPLPFVD